MIFISQNMLASHSEIFNAIGFLVMKDNGSLELILKGQFDQNSSSQFLLNHFFSPPILEFMKARPRIYTVGHSNRSIKEFIEMIRAYKLKLIVDVRTIPKSRHNPQFREKRLANSLTKEGIEYIRMAGLGGLRPTSKDSVNKAWRNKSFRGYADYMETDEFQKSLKRLISKSKRKRLAIMCAEAVPWRCHRSLVADALLVHGLPAEEIFTKTSHRPHKLTSFARVRGKTITYPG